MDSEGRVVRWIEKVKIDGQIEGGYRWQNRESYGDRVVIWRKEVQIFGQIKDGGRNGQEVEVQIDGLNEEREMDRKRVEVEVVRCRRDKIFRWGGRMIRQKREIEVDGERQGFQIEGGGIGGCLDRGWS